MSALAGLTAQWVIGGSVLEKRELLSQKNASWRGYVVKVQTLGSTFELNVSAELYAKVEQQGVYKFVGHFEEQQGRQKLIGDRVEAIKQVA